MKDPIIRYKLVDEKNWRYLTLDKEQFYDSDEKEFSIFDSVEKHFLEPRQYINFEHSRISFLNFFLEDEKGHKVIKKITYWNNGSNQIQEYIQLSNNIVIQRTLISSVYLDDEMKDCLVTRFDQYNENLIPVTQIILKGGEILKTFDIPKSW